MVVDKKLIRRDMRGRRAELSGELVLEYSGVIWRKIYAMPSFQGAETLLLYSSFGNEISTGMVARKAMALGKRVAYPVTNTVDKTMEFHVVNDLSELGLVKSGRFKLYEPEPKPETKVVPGEDTLMIVPGLAFDKAGYRTGYGGGFYDKYIAKYPSLMTLGVCYGFQIIDRIPRDAHDQPVGTLVTEGIDV